ncbi:unnamed protein product, partial [Musa banksii]
HLSRVLATEVRCLHLCFLISTRDDFWPISALLLRVSEREISSNKHSIRGLNLLLGHMVCLSTIYLYF